jgi:hypothetical protein
MGSKISQQPMDILEFLETSRVEMCKFPKRQGKPAIIQRATGFVALATFPELVQALLLELLMTIPRVSGPTPKLVRNLGTACFGLPQFSCPLPLQSRRLAPALR